MVTPATGCMSDMDSRFRVISQTILASCHGIIKFLWAALQFIVWLQAAAVATIHRPPLEINKVVNAATSNSSNTSTPIGLQNHEPEWVLDSGASCCVTGNSSALQGLHRADTVIATVANGQPMCSTLCGRTVGRVNLSGIRFFENASANLISSGFLVRQGCEIRQNIQGVEIWKGDVRIGGGRLLPNNTWSVDFLDDTHLGDPECTMCPSQHFMLID